MWFRPDVRSGFTLIEITLALVLTAVGILAVVGMTIQATRTLGESRRVARAASVGMRRLELLRDLARTTTPRCLASGFSGGAAPAGQGMTERWLVGSTGSARTVVVIVDRPSHGAIRPDTFASIVLCE